MKLLKYTLFFRISYSSCYCLTDVNSDTVYTYYIINKSEILTKEGFTFQTVEST